MYGKALSQLLFLCCACGSAAVKSTEGMIVRMYGWALFEPPFYTVHVAPSQ